MAKIPIDIKGGKIKEEREIIVGIDLGTTNSLVSYIEEGKALVVKDQSGSNTLVPSVVHFNQDANILVGREAKEKLITDPERTIFSAKRLMGRSYNDLAEYKNMFSYEIIETDDDRLVKVKIDDKYYTPVELSAEILKELKTRVESELMHPVEKAVITVPAYFNDTQRQATRDAGKLAGLNVLRVINEPTAASLAYGLNQKDQDAKKVAVYDLGGGTFDISILSIDDGVFEVLSTNGSTFLGGDDLDKAILDYWIAEKQVDEKLLEDESFVQKLRLAAELTKINLSTTESYSQSISSGDQQFELKMSLEKFNLLIQPLVDQTIENCMSAIKDSELNIKEIDKLVLVGGSTRVPLVRERVAAFFGLQPEEGIDPDEVVAIGAAIQADILAGNRTDMLLLDITPLSLGIETVGGLMDVILPRNSKIPSKVGRKYTTSVDGQTNLKVAVYQGERDLIADNRKLGEFVLQNIPPMPAGIPQIEIQFLINADGILVVKAKELRSNTETKLQIKSQYGISEEDMGRMLLDSIQNAKSDMGKRAFIEVRNEVDNISIAVKRFVKQNQTWLTEGQVAKIISLEQDMKSSLESGDVAVVRKSMDVLNKYTEPLAHEALDKHIGDALKGNVL